MNAVPMNDRPAGRFTGRPQWPDAPVTVDREAMHPRAVELAEAMREGLGTFRDLVGAGFTAAEITEFHAEARALATSLAARQVSPGADLLAEMVTKARAAIAAHRPMPKGATETQALFVAWGRYCAARAAYLLDPWDGQRERCLDLLRAYFRATPAGEAVTGHVVRAVAETMGARH
jgi:hypothetical protein